MPKTREDRNAEVRRALDSTKCQHEHGDSRDRDTGDFFCGDCGDVLIPWAQQTERQHKSYVFEWGQNPPAQQGKQ